MKWQPFRRRRDRRDQDLKLEQMARGDQARELLKNETLSDAVNWGKERALQSLRDATGPGEAWQAALALQAAEQFEGVLHAYLSGGEVASRRLAEENERMVSERDDAESATDYRVRAERARREFAAA